MSDPDAIEFFLRTTIAAARKMPIGEARAFLRGLLLVTEDRPEVAVVQSVYVQLCVADDQLELIAMGQLRLNLGADGDGQHGGAQS